MDPSLVNKCYFRNFYGNLESQRTGQLMQCGAVERVDEEELLTAIFEMHRAAD